jgi:hypothetical protein
VRTNTLILFLATEAIQALSVRFSRRQKQWSNENKALVGCFIIIIIIIMTGEFIYSAALMAVTILRVGRCKDFGNEPMEST